MSAPRSSGAHFVEYDVSYLRRLVDFAAALRLVFAAPRLAVVVMRVADRVVLLVRVLVGLRDGWIFLVFLEAVRVRLVRIVA